MSAPREHTIYELCRTCAGNGRRVVAGRIVKCPPCRGTGRRFFAQLRFPRGDAA